MHNLKNTTMNYLVMIGSDMCYGTSGVLQVQVGDKFVDFFRIREIYRARSEGSYLAVDCDIKDQDNVREIKLFKSKPVSKDENVIVTANNKQTIVTRQDGSTIVNIEQLELDSNKLLEFEPLKKTLAGFPPHMIEYKYKSLEAITIDAVIQITGNFFAGQFQISLGKDFSKIGGVQTGGNLMMGTGGIRLSNNGFSM